jgi:putative serine protease PepD
LKRSDIITKIGDVTITSVEDVFAAIRQHKIGDEISVKVVRSDVTRDLTVTLGSDAGPK